MAIKASNQVTLVDLTDGFSVVLTNENHTFIGGTSAVNGTQTATTQIVAFLPVKSKYLVLLEQFHARQD